MDGKLDQLLELCPIIMFNDITDTNKFTQPTNPGLIN